MKEEVSINEAIEKIDLSIDKHLDKLRTNNWCKLIGKKRRVLEEEVNALAFQKKMLLDKKYNNSVRIRSYRDITPQTKDEIRDLYDLIDSS